MQLRLAQLEDAEKIAAVINSAFRQAEGFLIEGDRISMEEVRQFLDSGKFLLAESEDIVLGCVYVEPRVSDATHERYAYLGLLAVDPNRQRSGVGSMLMEGAEDYCRSVGCRFMEIKIVNLRNDLPAFYGRRGYVETGTSPFPADVQTLLPCHFIDMSKPL
ncbi:MAG TPA: GNAT family N-acetyltransferase [Pyrinomonadaceae bacterium]|nr:GNAT family N-acetyltransferase [Pyrinomonadaceae bacterium]